MSDRLITIARFNLSFEAHLLVGKLEAEGVRAYVAHENFSSMFSGMQHLGGVMVQVADQDVELAAEIMARVEAGEEMLDEEMLDQEMGPEEDASPEEDQQPLICPDCGSTNVTFQSPGCLASFFTNLIFGKPLLLIKDLKCQQCGRSWKG